jgi:hypothetical protein
MTTGRSGMVIMHMTRIYEVFGLNINRDTGYPKVFFSPSRQMLGFGHERVLPNPFQFMYFPTIRRYKFNYRERC